MAAELVVVKGKDRGAFLALDREGAFTLGRADTCDLRLRDDKKVSTAHARVTVMKDEKYVLEDLASTNGTYVNDERVSSTPLRSGDRLKIGNTLLIFRTDASSVHLSDLNVRSHSKGASSVAPLGEDKYATALVNIIEVFSSAIELKSQLERSLRIVLETTGAARAILFLRDPDAGNLGCASAIGREDTKENLPVDSDALRKAVGGELAAPTGELMASAAPVKFRDRVLGALYIDAPGGRESTAREGPFLAAAARTIALAARGDRLTRIAETAIEVVGLAQAPPARASVDGKSLIDATARLYGPVAEARGLSFECEVPEGLAVNADELLLSRALDRLVESSLVSAKGGLRIVAEPKITDGVVWISVMRGGPPLTEAAAQELLGAEGPAGDLKRALERLSDGALVLARAAVARSGGRLMIEPASGQTAARYIIEVPLG